MLRAALRERSLPWTRRGMKFCSGEHPRSHQPLDVLTFLGFKNNR